MDAYYKPTVFSPHSNPGLTIETDLTDPDFAFHDRRPDTGRFQEEAVAHQIEPIHEETEDSETTFQAGEETPVATPVTLHSGRQSSSSERYI